MKSRLPALLPTILTLVSALAGQRAPPQPVDPTAQAPSTKAPAPPPTLPAPEAKPSAAPRAVSPDSPSSSQPRVFIGAIVHHRHAYMLKSANTEYRLDNQQEAKKYAGRDVKVTGVLEGTGKSPTILVQAIEASPYKYKQVCLERSFCFFTRIRPDRGCEGC